MSLEEALAPFAAVYAALDYEPLRITVTLDAPVVTYENPHFDGILSRVVVERATQGWVPGQIERYVRVPLPLKAIWEGESWAKERVPLWASTDLLPPEGRAARDELWVHRRALRPSMTRQNIQTTKGQHKERRTPLPVLVNRTLSCEVIGHADTIADLLQDVISIGKKRHVTGAVQSWNISRIRHFSLADPDGHLRRSVPLAALFPDGHPLDVDAQHISFSPPYWHHSTRTLCLPAGANLPSGARDDW